MWFGRENDENVVGLEIDVVGLPPLPTVFVHQDYFILFKNFNYYIFSSLDYHII